MDIRAIFRLAIHSNKTNPDLVRIIKDMARFVFGISPVLALLAFSVYCLFLEI